MSTLEQYYDANPLSVINRNQWTEYDPTIAVRFRQQAIFTPLVSWVPLDPNAAQFVTGREAIPGHINHNQIGLRQKYITSAYLDSRERKISANKRYGAKVQFEEYDEIVNQWRSKGRAGFANGILRQHLSRSIVGTHEKLARDAMIANVAVNTYAGGAGNINALAASSDYKFDVRSLRDVNLRLSVRAQFSLQEFGDYANPIPGMSGQMLAITTPGVIYDVEDQVESQYMRDVRDLQGAELMNGFKKAYRGWVFLETWEALLWNTGAITRQVAVTAPIQAGEGAPDPDADPAVLGVWYIGQGGGALTHYVSCTDLGTGVFLPGDFVSLHVARTTAYGVTDGCNPLDGKTMVLEVQTVDEVNERLVFKSPVMDDFAEAFAYTTLAGGASTGTAYAFVTKAAHIHPVYEIAARGGNFFAIKRKVKLATPPAVDDFESVVRVSWNEHGEMNKWNPDLWEMHYVRATFGNRGALAV